MLKNLALATAIAGGLAAPALAQEMPYPDTIVILDVSNSMWGQIDGVPKIGIAREVIGNLVQDLETDSAFGLMAYGHSKSQGCDSIEMILPVGPLDPEAFGEAVNSLTPQGRTPLVAAVKQAADSLEYPTRSGRIVLISDGTESCDGDLAALADTLGADSLDFTAHVIGFGVGDPDEQAELGYLAEKTGGLFVAADSTEELKAALQSMMGDMDEEPADGEAMTDSESMTEETMPAEDAPAGGETMTEGETTTPANGD